METFSFMDFYALILGLYATIFGGLALCYGLVKLGEKVAHVILNRGEAKSTGHHLPRAA